MTADNLVVAVFHNVATGQWEVSHPGVPLFVALEMLSVGHTLLVASYPQLSATVVGVDGAGTTVVVTMREGDESI